MQMTKTEAAPVPCNLFDCIEGYEGSGRGGHIKGDKPRSAVTNGPKASRRSKWTRMASLSSITTTRPRIPAG